MLITEYSYRKYRHIDNSFYKSIEDYILAKLHLLINLHFGKAVNRCINLTDLKSLILSASGSS